MRITELSLKNFRNHTEYMLTPHSSLNIFTGENGQGKTTILEALSLCLRGRSFRQGKTWIQEGCQQATILVGFENEYGKGQIQAVFNQEKLFSLYFNGKKTKQFPFQNLCVFFTPDELNAIRGEALYRRKLLDDLVAQHHPQVCRKFNKILVQKTKFLKQSKQGRYDFKDQKALFQSLQEVFVQSAEDLIRARFQALEEITPFWKEKGSFFLQTDRFEAQYLCQKKRVASTPQKAVSFFKEELKEKEVLERLKGGSLVGPHRDDLRFLYNNHEARESLSQGQQKALLLSWKMAQWSQTLNQTKPLVPSLFFDDVFSEIDQQYQKNLLGFLLENQAQSFITMPVWNLSVSPTEGEVFDLGKRVQREIYDGRKTLTK